MQGRRGGSIVAGACGLAFCCTVAVILAMPASPAHAQAYGQKYPGQTIPDAPAPYDPVLPNAPAPSPSYRPAPRPIPAAPPLPTAPPLPAAPPGRPLAGGERDPQARELAAQLPLDPATANLQSRLPTDVPGTIRRLQLRVPNGGRVDLRTRPANSQEVIDALRH